MNVHITIYDNAIPMLDQIALISRKSARAALDTAGMDLRDITRAEFHKSQGHNWHVRINKDGKRIIYKGGPAVLGQRMNLRKPGPENMANFITSFLMAEHLTLVVAGMHKAFKPRYYAKEEKTNSEVPIEGDIVPQVLHGSYQILKKLDEGGTYESLDPAYKRLTRRRTMARFEFAKYVKRDFSDRGRQAAMGLIRETMTTKLEAMIGKQVNRATVKTKVWAS